jgi:hypothetical protein
VQQCQSTKVGASLFNNSMLNGQEPMALMRIAKAMWEVYPMRKLTLGTLLLIATTIGAGASDNQPLSAGKPAGIKAAQRWEDNTPLLVFGLAAVGIGIALAVSGDDNGPAPVATNPVTSSTTP